MTENESKVLQKLKRGEWIVRMSDIYTEPFMIITEPFPVDKDVSDQEVLQRLREKLPEFAVESKRAESQLAYLSKDTVALLTDICQHPFRGISKRFAVLGFSGSRGEAAKLELIRHNLVREQPVKLGKFKPVTFLIPTDVGLKYLKSTGHNVKNWDFVGYRISFEHRLWQWLFYAAYKERDYEVEFEKNIENYRIDVFAVKGDERIAVEIAITSGIELRKIFTLLRHTTKILIVCKDDRVREEVEKVIDKNAYERVRPRIVVTIANQFLDELRRTTTTTKTTPTTTTNVDGVGKEIGAKRF